MFASGDGKVRIECRFEQETLWLSQAAIASLYQITPQAITQHIKAIYEEGGGLNKKQPVSLTYKFDKKEPAG